MTSIRDGVPPPDNRVTEGVPPDSSIYETHTAQSDWTKNVGRSSQESLKMNVTCEMCELPKDRKKIGCVNVHSAQTLR